MSGTDGGPAFDSLSDEQVLHVVAAALAGRPRLVALFEAVTAFAPETINATPDADAGDVVDAEVVEDAVGASPVPSELEQKWNARQEAGLRKLAEIRRSMGSTDN